MGMEDKLVAPAGFDGPVKDRSCTDFIFTVLLIAVWVAMTVIGITSIQEGDVNKLFAPVDYNGSFCGYDNGLKDKPNLYYVNEEGSGVCVESCPSKDNLTELVCRSDVNESWSYADKIRHGYCLPTLESTEVVNYCVFNSTYWEDVQNSELTEYISEFVADIITARGYVFGIGFGVAIFLSFLYMFLLRIPGLVGLLVWTCIGIVFAALVAIGVGAWTTAEDWDDEGTKSSVVVNGTYAVAAIAWVLAFLWFCLFAFLCKRISLAIGVIKEAGRAISAMPLIILWPLVQLVGSVAFFVIWMVYAAYTASLGDITVKTVENDLGQDISFREYTFEQAVENRGWFLIFCAFWTLNFITAIGQIVIAMAVASWYFTRQKSSVGSWTVVASAVKTLFFHTGTAAFGSLIVAIVEMIQAILSYIRRKAKQSHNKIAEWIACCCICCFWCLENCLRCINKNAYVQTAIFSTSFCTSAANAFFLIARNIARVAAVSLLGEFVLTIMTAFVTILTTTIAYYAMDANILDDLNSIAGPTIMTAVVAYFTGKMITTVFGMAITTMLQCFVADEEMFPAQPFAEKDLRQWIDRHGATTVAADNPAPPAPTNARHFSY